jgi:hypothetical protein
MLLVGSDKIDATATTASKIGFLVITCDRCGRAMTLSLARKLY